MEASPRKFARHLMAAYGVVGLCLKRSLREVSGADDVAFSDGFFSVWHWIRPDAAFLHSDGGRRA